MMSVVLALPPRLSCNTRVNFESRYGMNGLWNGRMRIYWNQSQYKTNTILDVFKMQVLSAEWKVKQ